MAALLPITSNKFNCSSEEATLDNKNGFLCVAEAGHSLPCLSAVSVFREAQCLDSRNRSLGV